MILIPTVGADYHALAVGVWRTWDLPGDVMESTASAIFMADWIDGLNRAQGWGGWLAVSGNRVCCSLAVKAPLAEGTVEIGYGVPPSCRGQGVATRAVLALMPVLAGHGVTRVTAETAVANPASGRVLAKAGFTETSRAVSPDDGPVIWWGKAP